MENKEIVAILGASTNPERYSYKAFKMLSEHGHTPLPINPKLTQLEGAKVYPDLASLPGKVDTLTLYVKPAILRPLLPQIIALAPKRVIFNPGTEEPEVAKSLNEQGIDTTEACTLVLLSTGQF